MKELDRTRLAQAVKSIVCLRFRGLHPLAILLCLVAVVTSISFLFDGNVRARAAQSGTNGIETLGPPVMNLPRLASSSPVLSKPSPSEDHVWRKTEKEASSVQNKSELVPSFNQTLSLDEVAQRNLLSRAPMELTKAARQTTVVMTLPMPDGTFARFRVEESPVMAPDSPRSFPTLKPIVVVVLTIQPPPRGSI